MQQNKIQETIFLRTSNVNVYLDVCQAKFYFSAIEKVQVPSTISLAMGTSFHDVMETNYSQKVHSRKDLPIENVKDDFSAFFERNFSEVDKGDLITIDLGTLKDVGIKAIVNYQKNIAPRIIPAHVEKRLTLTFKDKNGKPLKYGLTGKIDLIDIYNCLIDHKTTSNKKTFSKEISVSNLKQVGGAYVLLARQSGFKIDKARIDLCLFDEMPKVRNIPVEIDTNHYLKMFGEATKAISSGTFLPNRNSFLCKRKYCKYFEHCEKMYGGKVSA